MNQKQIKIISSAAVVLVFVLVVGILANLIQINALNSKKKRLEAEIASLEQRITAYEDEIAYKNTDWYIEQYARENLNMQRRGEQIFR